MTAPTSVAEMIAVLPPIPNWPKYQDEVSAYFEATEPALRARLALAERVIREYLEALDALDKARAGKLLSPDPPDFWEAINAAEANLRLALPALST